MASFKYTDENEKKFQKDAKKYPKIDSMMLPALWLVQEQIGWVSPEAMAFVAQKLETTPIRVYEFATFYTMFNLKPIGKHHIELCKTLSCMLCGSEDIKAFIKQTLGISPGETTEDGLFTLSEVECMGACAGAPMMSFDGEYKENLTKQKVKDLLMECKK